MTTGVATPPPATREADRLSSTTVSTPPVVGESRAVAFSPTVALDSPAVDAARAVPRALPRTLAVAGRLTLRIDGESMAPLLRAGDHVLVEPLDAAAARRGDILVVRRGDDLVTHRLVRRTGGMWTTKGDRHRHLDSPFAPADLVGRVVAVERDGRSRRLVGGRWTVVTPVLGWCSWLEGALLAAIRRYADSPPGAGGRRWPRALVRLGSLPFRAVFAIATLAAR